MTVDIKYTHINKDTPAQLADGVYCLSGYNGNIFLQFFQQIPNIPSEIIHHKRSDDPSLNDPNPTDNSELPYYCDGEGVARIFVGKMQMTPSAAKQLIKNIQETLSDMEKRL